MIVWSFGGELKRVPNGKRVNLKCQTCKKQSTFHEGMVDDTLKVYFVVELYKKSKRVMQCGECLGVCDYYQMFPNEKKNDHEAAEKAQREMKERQHAEELKQKEKEAAERKKQEEIDRKRREEEQKRKDKDIDNELENLKKRLGK